ncbi:ead/Ea22-like family protein [Salmonella enterica]|nr:ead/Ea22-like family protein [Salmonella enterica]ECB8793114.1 ead/Ea22-like family protein [Salmonella enterica subsp. enterica serovar Saintpaul]ECD9045841.1 ead/Ea22-like family protein [Salmonella enterica subsp. enterica]ECG9969819.1 ead/Ea22-like family protein [Salmonella enterica subsp. enterica serovar Schwarzengrund]ECT2867851.1 ead/Ea22-like family protein [Salmonella enterica subsp. enterica serovar Panama]EDJ7417034.1 ead/Ea22-like family protein [Salmonella enterica subsp. ent
MTIDKRALREVAEKATPGTWRRTSSLFNGITVTPFSLCGEEVTLAHTVGKRDAEFIAAANPATMLALLDENIQLQREKDAIEAVALALRDDMRQAREQLEAAEKRNAEQREYYEGVIADGSKRIAELEAREVMLPDRKSEIFWPGDAAEFDILGYVIAVKSAIRAAGIKVKES